MDDKLVFLDKKYPSTRKDYNSSTLSKKDLHQLPERQFLNWLDEAYQNDIREPNAFSLATAIGQEVNQRMLLLKAIYEDKLIFFSSYGSAKGQEIDFNNQVSALFFWPELERQVRIKAFVEKTDEEISNQYFNSRPFMSKLACTVSKQSREVESREELNKIYKSLEKSSLIQKIERPENWGGYQLTPFYYEFWQGRQSRLHDRLVYKMVHGNWEIVRLCP